MSHQNSSRMVHSGIICQSHFFWFSHRFEPLNKLRVYVDKRARGIGLLNRLWSTVAAILIYQWLVHGDSHSTLIKVHLQTLQV